MPVIPALKKLRQGHCGKLETSLDIQKTVRNRRYQKLKAKSAHPTASELHDQHTGGMANPFDIRCLLIN